MLQWLLGPYCPSLVSWRWRSEDQFVREDLWEIGFAYEMEVWYGAEIFGESGQLLEMCSPSEK